MFTKCFANGKPIKTGKHQVEEDKIRRQGDRFLNCVDAIGRGCDGEAVSLQIESQQAEKVLIVIHHQNFLTHTHAQRPKLTESSKNSAVSFPQAGDISKLAQTTGEHLKGASVIDLAIL